MTQITRHIKHLLLLCATVSLLAACDKQSEREICDYKVLLRYDYNEENAPHGRNMIEYYVHSIDEYIFDDRGILYAMRRITPDICRNMMDSEWNLDPGKYSVIAVGNMDERSVPKDEGRGNAAPKIGVTHRDDMRLSLDNAESLPNGTTGYSEKLYHGYRTFTVNERGISRIRVDMINAHCTIRFRVTWRNNATPPRGVEYHATLDDIASHYKLMPEYIYPRGSFKCKPFDADTYDDYPSDDNTVIHHIPHTHFEAKNILSYRNDTKVNADSEMWGEFTTYRFKMAHSPQLNIVRSSDGQSVIPHTIDLWEYFDWYDYEPDYALKQEYYISIVIDGDAILLTPLNVADWDEGGFLGS